MASLIVTRIVWILVCLLAEWVVPQNGMLESFFGGSYIMAL